MTLATESEIIGRMPEHEPMPESGEEIPVARVWHATPPPIPPPFPPPSGYAGTPNYGSYSALYVRPSKPGIITAMGVMSIVVACVSLGACVTSAVQALVEIGFVRVLGQVALNATNRRAVSAAATQASAPSDTGLAFDERQVVLKDRKSVV